MRNTLVELGSDTKGNAPKTVQFWSSLIGLRVVLKKGTQMMIGKALTAIVWEKLKS